MSIVRFRYALPLLAAFVLVLNANTLTAFFVGDDYDYLRWFSSDLTVKRAVTLEFWDEWEPAWYLTWYVDQRLWGLNPLGFHVQNLLWLSLLVGGLFGLMREVWPEEPIIAWSAALLFATHPAHDEAVAYLAARGHLVCAAFSVLALWLYTRFRQLDDAAPRGRRLAWLGGALVAAALAALAKEIALLLPLWIAALEWAVLSRNEQRTRRTLIATGLFAAAAASTLGLRAAVVGLESQKLAGKTSGIADLLGDLVRDLPVYASIGWLPVPFAWLDELELRRFAWVGAIVLAAVVAGGIAALWMRLRGPRLQGPAAGLYLFAMTVFGSALFPVFWAELPLRRRYLFIPSLGIVIAFVVILPWAARRLRRVTAVVLALLILLGSAGTLQRNDLYRRAGNVALNMIETIRGVPVDQPFQPKVLRKAVLVALPDRYGGDSVSGAYLFHFTDFFSALKLFAVGRTWVDYAMRLDYAEDFSTKIISRSRSELDIRVSFRSRRVFERHLRNDPALEPHGKLVRAERIEVNEAARAMTYRVTFTPGFRQMIRVLYLYSDGTLVPVLPQPGTR